MGADDAKPLWPVPDKVDPPPATKKRCRPHRLRLRDRQRAVEYVAANGLNMGALATHLGVFSDVVANWLASDPLWRAEIDKARLQFLGTLEKEAYRRAHDGVEELRFAPGGVQYTVRKYSDQLLMKLLDANGPEKYGNKIRVENQTTVEIKAIGLDQLPLAARLKLMEFLDQASPTQDAEYRLLPESADVQDSETSV